MPTLRLIRKLGSLPAADRHLLTASAVLLILIRIALQWLPFRLVVRALDIMRGNLARRHGNGEAVPRVRWAIATASLFLPWSFTCLAGALAGQVLLCRCGNHASLRIGVAKHPDGGLVAHAWLERDGSIVLDGSEAALYTPLVEGAGQLT